MHLQQLVSNVVLARRGGRQQHDNIGQYVRGDLHVSDRQIQQQPAITDRLQLDTVVAFHHTAPVIAAAVVAVITSYRHLMTARISPFSLKRTSLISGVISTLIGC